MIKRSQLTQFLDTFLDISGIDDGSFNGLQFEGKDEVKTVAFAVDAGIDTFKKASQEKADFLIVHHGQFWKGANPSITSWNKKRIDILYQNQMSLYAAHLPLDRHKEVGNNAQILELLGVKITEEFLFEKDKNIGWIGKLPKPLSVGQIEKIISEKLTDKYMVLPFGPKEITTIAVCSGGGAYGAFFEACQKKVDLYISGDQVEVFLTAKDAGIHVIFAGHHATEVVGLKALQKEIEKKFKNLKTVFIDIPTGL